ncbi:hypothetical protein CspeluHIS016_0700700 [Cutaneotrichosporon spelunceum]|uniref:Uncharacterized protein n=1 Tax=Cutaneotrichosporon spelunceum TaxID=1672016 RepID=A0AAD3TY49_9TREE|nr:hypothetical protein CspeluHIS016_0700700 [Cutaneotrichosporon spelunceum]
MSTPHHLPDELPDRRDPELEALALTAVRIYNATRKDARTDELGGSEPWLAIDNVCFTLAVLHNAWLEMKSGPTRLPCWEEAMAKIARSARLAYDTHVLTTFKPEGSTLLRPSFGVGCGFGARHVPPPREEVQAYVEEVMEWWWLAELRALAETRLPKGYAQVLDRVPILPRASFTPPASPAPVAQNVASPGQIDSSLPLDSAYAHKSLHVVMGWRANAQMGILALHVERGRWVWYSDFRPSDTARKVLTEAGISPLLTQPMLPGSLRGNAWE